MGDNDRREACAGTNEEDFQEEGMGWTGPLPERTSLARFLVDSLPTARGGPRSLKERERWQGSVSEGCLESPHVESQMLPAMLHSLGPLSSSTESAVTSHNYKHLRNVAEWPTRRTPNCVSPGSAPLHERTLQAHTDACDGPHEGLAIKGERVMTAFLWKLMTVVSGQFSITCTFRSVHGRPTPVLAQDVSRNVEELGRSPVHLVSGQGGPRTSTALRKSEPAPQQQRAPQTHPPAWHSGSPGGARAKDLPLNCQCRRQLWNAIPLLNLKKTL